MSADALAVLRAHVAGDTACAERLHALTADELVAGVLRLAAELKLDLADGEVQTAIAAERRAWLERWTT